MEAQKRKILPSLKQREASEQSDSESFRLYPKKKKRLPRFPSCVIDDCNKPGRRRCQRSFRFPEVNIEQKVLWLEACRLPEVPKNARICGNHFLSGAPSKTRLDPDYIPSIFSWTENKKPETTAEMEEYSKMKDDLQQQVENIVQHKTSNKSKTNLDLKQDLEKAQTMNKNIMRVNKNLMQKIAYLEKRNSYLLDHSNNLTKRNEELLARLERTSRYTFRGTQTRQTDYTEDSVEFSDDEFVQLTLTEWRKSISVSKESKLKRNEFSRKTKNMEEAEKRGELPKYLKQLERKYERRKKLKNRKPQPQVQSTELVASLQPVDPSQVPEAVKLAFQSMLGNNSKQPISGLVPVKLNPVPTTTKTDEEEIMIIE